MKTVVINTFIFLAFVPFMSFAQETQTTETKKNTAIVSHSLKKETVVYSFPLLANYDEANTNQHVSRIEQITQSKIKIRQKTDRIEVEINSTKIKDNDLDNLLRGLIVLNGYFSYEIID